MRWWIVGMLVASLLVGLGWGTRAVWLPQLSPLAAPTPSPVPAQVATASATQISADQLYSLINAHRKEYKLSPLTAHLSLESSAQRKLRDMHQLGYWRHLDTRDTPSWYFFTEAGYNYRLAGENLAFGATSPWQIFSDWAASPRHNAELLKPEYQDMGLAIDCSSFIENNTAKCVVVLHLAAPK